MIMKTKLMFAALALLMTSGAIAAERDLSCFVPDGTDLEKYLQYMTPADSCRALTEEFLLSMRGATTSVFGLIDYVANPKAPMKAKPIRHHRSRRASRLRRKSKTRLVGAIRETTEGIEILFFPHLA
jgi:hypothetical protein